MDDESKRETVADLRRLLRQAEVDCAYWRGRAEALERVAEQSRPAQSAANLSPELMTALLAAKMKEKQGAQEAL